MSPAAPDKLDIPPFLPKAAQAAEAIKRGIKGGVWQSFLPGERRLCEMFHVSRPTIRIALHLLAKNGLITIRQGRPNQIVGAASHKKAPRNRMVAIITREPFSILASNTYQSIAEMRALLASRGFVSEVYVCPSGSAAAQRRRLEAFVQQTRPLCCVLISVSIELQQWFAAHGIAALVLGSCHGSVALPSLDVDYRSVCRHAAGIFIRHRHRRLAFIIQDLGAAGDFASEQGFLEAAEEHADRNGVSAVVVRHDGTPAGIIAKLDKLFASPTPPTALLVGRTEHVIMVLIYLLRRGLAVPEHVSLIARDQDFILTHVSPAISHYSFKNEAYEHRLTRLMMQMLNQGRLPPVAHLIFPTFEPGGTFKTVAN